MPLQFTNTGLQIDTYDEIYSRLVEGFKVIYGEDISVDPDDPDGQRIGIFSGEILDAQTTIQLLYSQFDPDLSTGTFFDIILKYTGIVRGEEESLPSAKIRRRRSLELAATSTLGGVLSRLLDTAGITDVQGHENKSNLQDTERDMVPYSMWLIVEGGDPDTIAEVISKNTTGGTPLKGDEVGTYLETVPRDIPPDLIVTHLIRYDIPEDIDLYIQMDARQHNTSDIIDVDKIKQILSELPVRIEQSLDAGELYGPSYGAGDNFTLSALELSLDDITYTDEKIFPGYGFKLNIDIANITITELAPL